MSIYALMRKAIFALDPEEAHKLSLVALSSCAFPNQSLTPDTKSLLSQNLFGLDFEHPIGLAAGYDKNAQAIAGVFKMGFAFAEFGTTTPLPQSGNEKPRLFRLVEQNALINRLGFNNEGHAQALKNLLAYQPIPNKVVGINIGANKTSQDRIQDYCLGVQTFAPHTQMLTINISSPNTPGLRDLQEANQLDELLSKCVEARNNACKSGKQTPLLIKFAPDLDLNSLDKMLEIALKCGMDGIILTNTTIDRPPSVQNNNLHQETGGLSGQPLFEKSTWILAHAFLRIGDKIPLIGVGGIHNFETLLTKIHAGASLTQLYSALVYEGPGLIAKLQTQLLSHLEQNKLTLSQIKGKNAQEIANDGDKIFLS